MEKQHLMAGALDTAGALVSFRKGCLTSSIGWVVADVGGRVDEPADVPLGADEEDSSPDDVDETREATSRGAYEDASCQIRWNIIEHQQKDVPWLS